MPDEMLSEEGWSVVRCLRRAEKRAAAALAILAAAAAVRSGWRRRRDPAALKFVVCDEEVTLKSRLC